MLTYHKGDLLKSGCDILCHQVNCQGVMGSGIAKQIREKYAGVYENYKLFVKQNGKGDSLGQVFFFATENWQIIANMFSQYNYLPRTECHTDYYAFRSCCKAIKRFIRRCWDSEKGRQPVIGFPYKIGCGLAGGDWRNISEILEEEFSDEDWNVQIWEKENA